MECLKNSKSHPKGLNNTLLTGKYSLLYIYIHMLICSQNNQHLKDKKAWSVHIYCMGMRSFKFSNCVEKNNAKLTLLQSLRMG